MDAYVRLAVADPPCSAPRRVFETNAPAYVPGIGQMGPPPAASPSLHEGVSSGGESQIIVYDLGGGTFDASLLSTADTRVSIESYPALA